MTAQEQIAKLESLLERIRRNAEMPRPVVAVAVAAEPPARAAEPLPAADESSLDALGATESVAAEPTRERVQSADMDDLEIVEIGTEIVELSADESRTVESDGRDALDEPVPESAPRPAVQSVEVELEPPIKTPPPESGRQAVTPPPVMAEAREAAASDDFDENDLLQPDLSGGPISIVTPGSPNMAQLGDTVHLDEPGLPAAEIELDRAPAGIAAPSSTDELEAALPKQRGPAGAYDAALAPPSTASSDLERHREVKPETRDVAPSRRVDPLAATVPDMRTALGLAKTVPDARSPFADAIRATTEARAEPPKVQGEPEPAAAPVAKAPEVVVERPAVVAAHAAEVILPKPRKMPETFLELLDASLELRA